MIALIDCNNFYASCEKLFKPSLEGRPVIVLSNNDSCVIARCPEAKRLGIDMGTPYHLIREQIRENGIEVFSSNYTLYGSISARIKQILASFGFGIEMYSIDEAFLELDTVPIEQVFPFMLNVKTNILEQVGIPVSVGIARTKTLAKLANRRAKQDATGICFFADPMEERNCLVDLPLAEVWGIGKQMCKFLEKNNIKTAEQFIDLQDSWIRRYLFVTGLRIKYELMGIACLPFEESKSARKQICVARSFAQKQPDLETLREVIQTFIQTAAEKLQKENSVAGSLLVFIETNPHNPAEKQYSRSIKKRLPVATNNITELIRSGLGALDDIFIAGYAYMKAGVILSQINSEQQVQLNLFHPISNVADKRKLRGESQLSFAMKKEVKEKHVKNWHLKAEWHSPRYTTRLSDIMKVKS